MMQTWSMLMMAYCGLCGKLVVFYKIMFSHCYCAGAGMMQCVTTVHNFIFLNVTFTPTCICPNSWYLMLIGILGSLRMFQIYFYISSAWLLPTFDCIWRSLQGLTSLLLFPYTSAETVRKSSSTMNEVIQTIFF